MKEVEDGKNTNVLDSLYGGEEKVKAEEENKTVDEEKEEVIKAFKEKQTDIEQKRLLCPHCGHGERFVETFRFFTNEVKVELRCEACAYIIKNQGDLKVEGADEL